MTPPFVLSTGKQVSVQRRPAFILALFRFNSTVETQYGNAKV